MGTLAVYNVGDFASKDVIASIRQIRESKHPIGESIRTPLMKQQAFRDIAFSANPPWPLRAGIDRRELDDRASAQGLREN